MCGLLLKGLDSLYEKKEDEFIRENDNLVSASLIYVRLSALNKNKMLRENMNYSVILPVILFSGKF